MKSGNFGGITGGTAAVLGAHDETSVTSISANA
jgi:hypothetical protein